MANVAGRKSEDDYTIYYLPIDKVYSDVMLVIFTPVSYTHLDVYKRQGRRELDCDTDGWSRYESRT